MIILQEQIDTVTVEGAENVGGEEWIEIKTEEDCIQLVGRVKCEQEVSVLCCVFCGGELCTGGLCVCIVYIVFSCALFSYIISVSACQPADVPVSFQPGLHGSNDLCVR
jgi:hypothetical protein